MANVLIQIRRMQRCQRCQKWMLVEDAPPMPHYFAQLAVVQRNSSSRENRIRRDNPSGEQDPATRSLWFLDSVSFQHAKTSAVRVMDCFVSIGAEAGPIRALFHAREVAVQHARR
ncbi:hypothetical protein GX51_05209 [Blastomyces parvus]|uniref:Uncharacterized protein n=1 Tax=Blastomyces parvus TaxID=2060905 RepID=A0A2B7WYF1_9EURO|nr:hypothetical protein GX51_05209 [Blastomyces parvus]